MLDHSRDREGVGRGACVVVDSVVGREPAPRLCLFASSCPSLSAWVSKGVRKIITGLFETELFCLIHDTIIRPRAMREKSTAMTGLTIIPRLLAMMTTLCCPGLVCNVEAWQRMLRTKNVIIRIVTAFDGTHSSCRD